MSDACIATYAPLRQLCYARACTVLVQCSAVHQHNTTADGRHGTKGSEV